MDCNQLRQPPILVKYLRSESRGEVDRALNCFYELFYEMFSRMGGNYCYARSYTRYKGSELTDDAFSRGLLNFYQKIKSGGFDERGASVETAFISFCLWQLKGVVKTEERTAAKFGGSDPSLVLEKKGNDGEESYLLSKEENEAMDNREQLFQKGFALLDKRCRDLITWRKLLQLDNEEIAARSGLEPGSVNNEVYKCMKKLKKIIDELSND
jgi:RNA polymerase sigma factor (sigma-70 family)